MKVGFCDDVSLFQLADFPKPEQMFNSKYPFQKIGDIFRPSHTAFDTTDALKSAKTYLESLINTS